MAYYLLVVVMGCNVQRLFFLVGGVSEADILFLIQTLEGLVVFYV